MNLIRGRVADWRRAGYPDVTATTLELLNYWRRDGRLFRPFFAQLEAVETIIFLNEARRDYLQGLDIPRDEPSDKQKEDLGYKAFQRWTSKDVREIVRSHLNYAVADTKKWEQEAAYHIDTHPIVDAFVKNAGLGFAIPYLHNGQPHDYVPDFIIRLKTDPIVYLILETKGFDELADVKSAAAQRWVAAVNADGRCGQWQYEMARAVPKVRAILDQFVQARSSAARPVSALDPR